MKVFTPVLNKFCFITLLLFCLYGYANAQTVLKGKVTDAKNGEPLIGATVAINNNGDKQYASVKLDGSYTFKNIAEATYNLQVRYLGYKTTSEYTIQVTKNNVAVLNVAMVDNATALNEVTVTEHASRETDKASRSTEKNANNTMNVVSANSIAISPDVLISNVLSRVSGLSVDRGNTGEAEHVIIRGMDKQYNTTLINGVKIPSPDNKDRYVPLNIFPANLVERVEVSKTLTPEMEGDASGGVVNLVMKTAPDALRVEGDLGTGYSQLYMDRGFSRGFTSFDASTISNDPPPQRLLNYNPLPPVSTTDFPYNNLITKSGTPPPNVNASLTIGNRFLNKKLGVIFSGTYQHLYTGSNTFILPQSNVVGYAPDINSSNTETNFNDALIRQYSSKLDRTGLLTSVDYKFNENNTITLFGTFLQLNEDRVRQTEDDVFGGYISYNGYRFPVEIDQKTETRTDIQSIASAILKGKHKLSKAVTFDWTLSDSKATHKTPDLSEFQTKQGISPDLSAGGGYQAYQPGYGTIYITNDLIVTPLTVGNQKRTWMHNTDQDLSGYANLHEDATLFGHKITFAEGGMFRHKTRDNYVDNFDLQHGFDPGSVSELYVSIPASTYIWAANGALGSVDGEAGVYTFEENVQAGFGDIHYFFNDRFDMIGGLRIENTYQHYDSNLSNLRPGKSATITYTDYLASLNAKYKINDIQALRAGFYQSVLRPAFADFIPYPDNSVDGGYPTDGDPYLQHTSINNFDLRYEAFPGALDEFMVGGFYKYLTNPIERLLTNSASFIVGTGSSYYLVPANLGNATNYGAEFVAKKFFGNIGISANYTYTKSQITTSKDVTVTGLGYILKRDQTRPLQGQSANIGNFSVLYKDTKRSLDAQIALVYTGERINAVSNYYGLDTWEKATLNLDFSAQKQFGKHYIFYIKVNNILNTPYELFLKQDNTNDNTGYLKLSHQTSNSYTTVEYDEYKTRYNLGFRFKF